MSFSSIDMLWLIWALPVLLMVCLWGFRKRRLILSGYATEKGLSAIAPKISPFRRWLKAALLLAIVLLLVVSLTGPQYGYSWKEIERRGVDLVIAMDCSRSMLAEDIEPNRLERAKREVYDLLDMIEGDRVGLVAFAGTAFLQCPLTLDYEGFHLFLEALSPDFLPVGGTDLAGAVTTALSAFDKEAATDKAVILITDGEATGNNPAAAAESAAKAGIKIFAIGIGASDGAPIPGADGGFVKDSGGNIKLSKLDESTLKQMAAGTSGAYVRSVAGDMDLDVIYQRHIRGTMEAANLGEQKTRVYENRYQWVLALALCLFFLELMLPERAAAAIWVVAILAAAAPRPAVAADLKTSLDQAQADYASGDYDAAVQHYISAQLEAPDKAEIAYNLGNAQYRAEDYDGAIQAYGQVLASEDVILQEKAHYNMGNAYFRKGDLDKAIESYEAALALDETDAQARENLEFAKLVKENPPQESSEGDKDQQEQSDQQDSGENQQSGDQGQSGSDEQERSGEEQGEENQEDRQQTESSPDESQQSASEPEEDKREAGGQQAPESPDEESLRQAEKMLNRLQDQPGRAMVPAYRQRQVEKDW
jgi:Ca-activated chloride channel family protein